jgi:2,4-didehydro-3-deoxy-L-rhamnonate hydrolase
MMQKLGALIPERRKWQVFMQVQAKRSQYLQPGDIVEARIASPDGRIDLGTQRNVVVAEAL